MNYRIIKMLLFCCCFLFVCLLLFFFVTCRRCAIRVLHLLLQFELVCEKKFWVKTSKSIYFGGRLLGAAVFGHLSDRLSSIGYMYNVCVCVCVCVCLYIYIHIHIHIHIHIYIYIYIYIYMYIMRA